jgi:6-phosphogluconolactonase (cycloisomerase 2 family)
MQKCITRTLLASVFLLGLVVLTVGPVAATDNGSPVGAVFVGTNHNNTKAHDPNEPANQVIMYHRASDGSLSLVGRFDTGGQGSGPSVRFAGDGLGSAHSVELSQDQQWLFVTNASSDDVTVFRVSETGLERTDLVPSGGVFPNSITQHGDLVYVLNSAGDGNITGFRLSNEGKLTLIPDSTRTINGNQDPVRPDTLFNPTQVSFTPDGQQLVVTIKDGPAEGVLPDVTPTGPGRVLVFGVDRDGRPTDTSKQTDLFNLGPFGFSFDPLGNLLVALFVGGPNIGKGPTAAAGSFQINLDGSLTPITLDAPNLELDTCWIENNGRYAYGANYTSGTISSYRIGNYGTLELLSRVAGTTDELPGGSVPGQNSQGSTPLDIRLSPDGLYLYNVLPGSGTVGGWRIKDDGSLDKIGEFPITIKVGNDEVLLKTVEGDHAPFEFGPGASPAGIAVY